MEAEDQVGSRILEGAFLDHQLGAAGLAIRRTLLRRLEDEHDRAGELLLHPREDVGDAELRGDMNVVAAGVGDADLAAEIGGLRDRPEGEVGLLGDRQRVHVGAHRDDSPRLGTAQDSDDTGVRHPGPDLKTEPGEFGGHQRGGAGLPIAQLRIAVDVLADLDHPRSDPGRRGRDFGIGLRGEGAGHEKSGEREGGKQTHRGSC